MRIRRLDVGDADLAVATMREFKGRSVSTAEAATFLGDSKHYLIVADDLGAPAGFLLAYRLNRIDRPAAKLSSTSWRSLSGTGVGKSRRRSSRSSTRSHVANE